MAFGILTLIMFFMLLCQCQSVRAIRSFPLNYHHNVKKKQNHHHHDLLSKYFNSSSFQFKSSSTAVDNSKRKVPSCPDPLHNK
ncbi:CLAVATA3/ESR [Bienertia sinuspersici]